MNIQHRVFVAAVIVAVAALCVEIAVAQAPARGGGGERTGGAASAAAAQGNLLQVMRGILFPNSNVIFAAQTQDPAAVKKDADPTASTNPLASIYGAWEAIENSGIAIAESARLLTVLGRVCSNGKPVPVQDADWQRFVRELRTAGMAAYKAGQSKDMDKVVEVSDTVATACANCHDVYREKTPAQGGTAARCTK